LPIAGSEFLFSILFRSSSEYDETRIKAFVCDLTEDNCFSVLDKPELKFIEDTEASVINTSLSPPRVDFVSMIFVLSAIAPVHYDKVIENLGKIVKAGGVVFFRDYGRFDMAQLRFKGGNKIDENFYVRRDGTRYNCKIVVNFYKCMIFQRINE